MLFLSLLFLHFFQHLPFITFYKQIFLATLPPSVHSSCTLYFSVAFIYLFLEAIHISSRASIVAFFSAFSPHLRYSYFVIIPVYFSRTPCSYIRIVLDDWESYFILLIKHQLYLLLSLLHSRVSLPNIPYSNLFTLRSITSIRTHAHSRVTASINLLERLPFKSRKGIPLIIWPIYYHYFVFLITKSHPKKLFHIHIQHLTYTEVPLLVLVTAMYSTALPTTTQLLSTLTLIP